MSATTPSPTSLLHRMGVPIVVRVGGESSGRERARQLASALDLPFDEPAVIDAPLTLEFDHEGLALHDHRARHRPLRVDFEAVMRRRGAHLTRRDPLARALGREVRTVADATAGFGSDALRLACFGLDVLAIERVPIVYALLTDGLRRATLVSALKKCIENLRVVRGDALAVLPALSPAPDAIYIDPMFPPKRRRSAATRKTLALLRELAGEDADSGQLLALSRSVARRRVIVKRPDDAAPLAPGSTVSYGGKLVRYDVYPGTGR